MTKIQLRGHCQCCGRQQAVVRGTIAQHGYTVQDGWFQGVCKGHIWSPVEHDREIIDKQIAGIRMQCDGFLMAAQAIEDGDVPSKLPAYRWIENRQTKVLVPVAEMTDRERTEAIRNEIFSLRRRAEIGQKAADFMAMVANTFHGKNLIEVEARPSPEQIVDGERRLHPNRGIVVTCTMSDRGKVFFKYEGRAQTFSTSTRAWRGWQKA